MRRQGAEPWIGTGGHDWLGWRKHPEVQVLSFARRTMLPVVWVGNISVFGI